MIYPFRKTIFDCKQATLLSIKKEQGAITFPERIRLQYHLLFCDPCKRFIEQSRKLDSAGRELDQQMSLHPPFQLSDSAREKMKKMIGSL
jgi:hypothetical protein